jgi:hypothetical protein
MIPASVRLFSGGDGPANDLARAIVFVDDLLERIPNLFSVRRFLR